MEYPIPVIPAMAETEVAMATKRLQTKTGVATGTASTSRDVIQDDVKVVGCAIQIAYLVYLVLPAVSYYPIAVSIIKELAAGHVGWGAIFLLLAFGTIARCALFCIAEHYRSRTRPHGGNLASSVEMSAGAYSEPLNPKSSICEDLQGHSETCRSMGYSTETLTGVSVRSARVCCASMPTSRY